MSSLPVRTTVHRLGPDALAIPAAFRRCAARFPDLPAVVSSQGSVRYGELDGLSDAIATAILERAPGEPAPIAVLGGHEWPAVAACLGVLKAGHFYVCLSPQDPPERLRDIVQVARPVLLLAEAALGAAWAALGVDTPVLMIEDALRLRPAPAAAMPGPSELLSVAFTSGSTGRPKGVMQTQEGVVYGAMEALPQDAVGPGDRRSLLASLSFGWSNQMYLALVHGAALHMYDASVLGAEGVGHWVESSGITLLEISTALYRAVLGLMGGRRRLPESVRRVMTSLEPLTWDDVEAHRAHAAAAVPLINTFASTETMWVSRVEAGPGAQPQSGALTAGYPCPGVHVEILDERGERAGEGAAGPVQVSGPMLALGYWDDPVQTAERFGRHPTLGRVARTGDLGRLLPDGRLELLGRVEQRAQVRGRTVYLGEVERALLSLRWVREAAVTAHSLLQGGERLTAYLVLEPGAEPTVRDLRLGLAELLPDHMVPAGFRILPQLPRGSRGKVDRQALAGGVPAPLSTAYVPPATPLERDLAALWCELLHLDQVGGRDQFFELGGDSLLAAEMAAVVQEQIGRDLPLGQWASDPTVVGCARLLEDAERSAPGDGLVTVQPRGALSPLFCFGGAGATALQWYPLAARLGTEQPVHVIEPKGMHSAGRPDRSVAEHAKSALAVLRRVRPHGPYRLAGHSFGAYVAFEVARLLALAKEPADLLVILDFPAPGDLTSPESRPVAQRVSRVLEPGGLRRSVSSRFDRLHRILGRMGVVRYGPRERYAAFRVMARQAGRRFRPAGAARVRRTLVVQAANGIGSTRPDMGWTRWLEGEVASVRVPGYHSAVLRQPPAELVTALRAEGLGIPRGARSEAAATHSGGV